MRWLIFVWSLWSRSESIGVLRSSFGVIRVSWRFLGGEVFRWKLKR